jgi:hypothetical protein
MALLVLACSKPKALPPLSAGPFVGLNQANLPVNDRQILQEASEDFCAVVQFKNPIHAVFDPNEPCPADGGTCFYRGKSYKLEIHRSLSTFGAFGGVAYGPIITFNENFAPGNTNQISDIRVYSDQEYFKLTH